MNSLCKKAALLAAVTLATTGCGLVEHNVAGNLSNTLTTAVENQNDPQLVAAALPAYLLMVDGMAQKNPDSADLQLAAGKLYSSYAGVFVTDKDRAANLNTKALNFALKGACLENKSLCNAQKADFKNFSKAVDKTDKNDVAAMYTLGTAWAGYIQSHSSDWNAIAQIPRIKLLMQQVNKLEPAYDHGGAPMYLGVLDCLVPPAAGGKPAEAKTYFEQAEKISNGKNLMVDVLYAQYYARTVFDEDLHNKLLNKVLAANPDVEGLTLVNTLAQKQARELLKSGEGYFN